MTKKLVSTSGLLLRVFTTVKWLKFTLTSNVGIRDHYSYYYYYNNDSLYHLTRLFKYRRYQMSYRCSYRTTIQNTSIQFSRILPVPFVFVEFERFVMMTQRIIDTLVLTYPSTIMFILTNIHSRWPVRLNPFNSIL